MNEAWDKAQEARDREWAAAIKAQDEAWEKAQAGAQKAKQEKAEPVQDRALQKAQEQKAWAEWVAKEELNRRPKKKLTSVLLIFTGLLVITFIFSNMGERDPEKRKAGALAKCQDILDTQRSYSRSQQYEREVEAATEAVNKRYRTPQEEREHREFQAELRKIAPGLTATIDRDVNASMTADYQRCMEKIK